MAVCNCRGQRRLGTWLNRATLLLLLSSAALCSTAAQDAQNATDASQCLKEQTIYLNGLNNGIARALTARNASGNDWNVTSGALQERLGLLLATCAKNVPKARALNIIAPDVIKGLLDVYLSVLEDIIKTKINFIVAPIERVADLIVQDLTDGSNLYDGYVFEGQAVVDIAAAGGFEDLAPYVKDDPTLKWTEFNRWFKEIGALYDQKIVGVPVFSNLPYLYYRIDIFDKYNLTVPQTWDEFVEIARKMNGTDFSGDNKGDFSICWTVSPGLTRAFTLMTILANLVQTSGPSQGFLFDPLSMQPLVNNEAMAYAMDTFRTLSYYNEDRYPISNAGVFYTAFKDGACLMTVNSALVFKNQPFAVRVARGNLGVALVPGSTRVLDRDSGKLVACTPDLCRDRATYADGRSVPINRAPYNGPSGVAVGVNPNTDPSYRKLAYDLAAGTGSNSTQFQYFTFSSIVQAGPLRDPLMSDDLVRQGVWQRNGFNANDTLQFLDITRRTINHPNRVKDVAIQRMGQHKIALDVATGLLVTTNRPIGSIMAELYTNMSAIIDEAARNTKGGPKQMQLMYWQYLGFQPPPSPPAPPSPPSPSPPAGGGGISSGLIAVAVAVPTALVVLAVAVCAVLWVLHRRRDTHRTLLGKVRAPGVGPDTTLLITDIQDSTVLWETQSQATMDIVIKLHHHAIREALLRHAGYESTTEGDSFILAFHTARDAALFAVDAQEELMRCAWPPEVLEVPMCRTTYATPLVSWDARAAVKEQMAKVLQQNAKGAVTAAASPRSRRNSVGSTGADMAGLSTDIESEGGDEWGSALNERPSVLRNFISRNSRSSKPRGERSSKEPSPRQSNNGRAQAGDVAFVMGKRDSSSGAVLPDGPEGAGGNSSSGGTVQAHIMRSLLPADGPGPGRILLYNGLRVRMGMHTGVIENEDVNFNRAVGRTQYTGSSMALAKAVQDVAQGAMVLLSEATFRSLRIEELRSRLLVGHVGEHVLKEGKPAMHLYVAMTPTTLIHRCATLGPVRSVEQVSSGFLQAPHGSAAIGFMYAVGLASLQAWSAELTTSAVALYQQLALAQLQASGGYLVEVADGLLLVALPTGAAAIRWALNTLRGCLDAPWDPELLSHELCEEVAMHTFGQQMLMRAATLGRRRAAAAVAGDPVGVPLEAGDKEDKGAQRGSITLGRARKLLLFRGLRLKCGIDMGGVNADIHAVSGRMTYRGRVMNRAARIAGVAKTGQVWCSDTCWQSSMYDINTGCLGPGEKEAKPTTPQAVYGGEVLTHKAMLPAADQVLGISVGPHKLKGISEEMSLVECRFLGQDAAGGASTNTSMTDGSVAAGGESFSVHASMPSGAAPRSFHTLAENSNEEADVEAEGAGDGI